MALPESPLLSPRQNVDTWLDKVRVDQNLFLNLPDIESTFKEDSVLVRDFIIFLAHNYKVDLFGFTQISTAEFSKKMRYDKTNLQRVHKHFKHEADVPKVGNVEMKSNFDYVLYRLYTQKIILSRTEKTRVPSLNIVKSTSVEVISDLNIIYDVKKPDRRIYQIKLNHNFLQNILNFYVTISLNDYLSVSAKRDDGRNKSLYLYLCGSRHSLLYRNNVNKTEDYTLTPNFDLLCEMVGIDETIKEPKHRKEKLSKYLQYIRDNSSLKFDYKFFVGENQKQAYSVAITFDKASLALEGARKNLLFSQLNTQLRKEYNVAYPKFSEDNELFQRWLTNREKDVELKEKILHEAYRTAFMSSSNKDEDSDLEYLFTHYLQSLKLLPAKEGGR